MPDTLRSFPSALAEAKKHPGKIHLLLGNGFSIACRPDIFLYGELFRKANFSKLSPYVRKAFTAFGTQDFEKIIKILRTTRTLLSVYRNAPSTLIQQLEADAEGLKELLVETIAKSHPERPSDVSEAEYCACRKFLANFDTTYTLNYDLLLYWAKMHCAEGEEPDSDDGFRKPENDWEAAYVTWEPGQSHEQDMWFLHGALHVFDAGTEVQKYTWKNTGVRLIQQIREALDKGLFPIFVSEGTSEEKYERIRHSDYLAKAYRSFESIRGNLFILGHSLAENDEHYLRCIERGKIERLYVGLHGDPKSPSNKFIINRATRMPGRRRNKTPLSVSFFDSGTAKVWGK
jgi:hypothetical protein